MTKDEVIELVGEEAIFYNDLDSALIGVAERFGMPTVACYDKEKAIEALKNMFNVTEADLDEDEITDGVTIEQKKEEMAYEWYDYNILGGWNGEFTPVFITISKN